MEEIDGYVNAIFGLSDNLALAGRDTGRTLGLADRHTLIVGIGGTPVALAAIADGSMSASVEIRTDELGKQAVELARRAAGSDRRPSYSLSSRTNRSGTSISSGVRLPW
jgi:ABC-type sugar transport system substrate-binding protein